MANESASSLDKSQGHVKPRSPQECRQATKERVKSPFSPSAAQDNPGRDNSFFSLNAYNQAYTRL